MIDDVTSEVRGCSENLKNAIIGDVTLDKASLTVEVSVITNTAFTAEDEEAALRVIKGFVPEYFSGKVHIIKLSPDCEMVKKKIYDCIAENFKTLAATMDYSDIKVEKTESGFNFILEVMPTFYAGSVGCAEYLCKYLKTCFCGEFFGEAVKSSRTTDDMILEERQLEDDFEIPVRTFKIENFSFLEGEERRGEAVYIADLNFAAASVVICGAIEDIKERSYVNKRGEEKRYLSLSISDGTATAYITYFIRRRSADKIAKLKAGDSIVCYGRNEEYKGNLRYTAEIIDFGTPPKGFVPQKRASKPVPNFYHFVQPQPFVDSEQTDLFTDKSLPECLVKNTFVVLDLETTGLNSSPVSGNMDKIIEIGAYKIEGGEISQCFSTFVNPSCRLSEDIVRLTGITPDMIASAPTTEEVMPDFFKFCSGSILVGHNIEGFDFKFVDYYCAKSGYILERKIIDTYPLSQELLFLSNYKLNTVAEKFNVTFNHHRATDDALATAKIFIELIKIKKSLPRL